MNPGQRDAWRAAAGFIQLFETGDYGEWDADAAVGLLRRMVAAFDPAHRLPPLDSVDIGNYQGVGATAASVVVVMPLRSMTRDQALVHAAWLTVIADPGDERFPAIRDMVEST